MIYCVIWVRTKYLLYINDNIESVSEKHPEMGRLYNEFTWPNKSIKIHKCKINIQTIIVICIIGEESLKIMWQHDMNKIN